jgi:hypothetical protein
MKKYIVSYLTENYYLDKSEIGNAGIYAFDDDRRFKVPSNAKKLIEEIVTLFGYSFTRTKWLIHDWAYKQKSDYCLKFYWKSHEIDGNIFMPIARHVAASLIGQDLVAVRPMSAPTGLLTYLDYTYGELDHPTPNYMLAVDSATPDAEPSVFKVEGLDAMRSQRERTIKKWQESGLLEGMSHSNKENIALLYESQAKQLLK